jgi:hypothetical protein
VPAARARGCSSRPWPELAPAAGAPAVAVRARVAELVRAAELARVATSAVPRTKLEDKDHQRNLVSLSGPLCKSVMTHRVYRSGLV